ncbi:hypothetical protein Droror1_Dr00018061 [Drosera rotundifolia]
MLKMLLDVAWRGLQIDVSLAIAWAYLGKLKRKLEERQLARNAFDKAKSFLLGCLRVPETPHQEASISALHASSFQGLNAPLFVKCWRNTMVEEVCHSLLPLKHKNGRFVGQSGCKFRDKLTEKELFHPIPWWGAVWLGSKRG